LLAAADKVKRRGRRLIYHAHIFWTLDQLPWTTILIFLAQYYYSLVPDTRTPEEEYHQKMWTEALGDGLGDLEFSSKLITTPKTRTAKNKAWHLIDRACAHPIVRQGWIRAR
jgi:hypothetical protein